VERRRLYTFAAVLSLIGLGLFLYKLLFLKFPLTPDTQAQVWDIEVQLTYVARGEPVGVTLLIPGNTRRYTVVNEHFISNGYDLSFSNDRANRAVGWSRDSARGYQSLYYRASVHRVQRAEPAQATADIPQPERPKLNGPERVAMEALVADLRKSSDGAVALIGELLHRLQDPVEDRNLKLLLGEAPPPLQRMQTAVLVLRSAGLSARVAHGIQLKTLQRRTPVLHWLQVYDGSAWRNFDPDTGLEGVPDDYLRWWYGDDSLLSVRGVDDLQAYITVALNRHAALAGATSRARALVPRLMDFSLFSLPVETQAVYHVLLLVPLGGFILVLLRNIVGIKTFGTFMPVLVALAFRETRLLWGILLFSVIVSFGLAIRFYLDRLKLLLVPRLAAVLTVVVLLMAAVSVVGYQFGLERGLSVALFPMVIMTMVIERMSIVWEERGAREAVQQGIGSLFAASLVYGVMHLALVEHLFFVYPELLMVLLAAILLLGRYRGYRLTELYRFRVLAKH